MPKENLAGVRMEKDSATVGTGKTITLKAQARPANAEGVTMSWESSDTAVATVNNGTVTGVKAGTANITVTAKANGNGQGFTATCKVTVVDTSKGQPKAYTVSTAATKGMEGLVTFNPELPASTASRYSELSGGSNIAGIAMAKDNKGLWYIENGGGITSLYYYDLTAKTSSFRGRLYTFTDASDLAYDTTGDVFYVTAGYYVHQFLGNSLGGSNLIYPSGSYDNSKRNDIPTTYAVTIKDKAVYYLGKGWGDLTLYKMEIDSLTNQMNQPTPVMTLPNLGVYERKTEMAYDADTEKFYVTDGGDRIYTFKLETGNGSNGKLPEGKYELVDVLGEGIDINGLAIVPASGVDSNAILDAQWVELPPVNPETPVNPEDPAANPENPETPENPENPENPETPETPENPENPETPETPENPENPENPVPPVQPELPGAPGGVDPALPVKPTDPEDPADPADPDAPTEPLVPRVLGEGKTL